MDRISSSYRPKKQFGQNFLKDESIIDELIAFIQPLKQDNLVEIGPGLGALSFVLLPYLSLLHVIELDRDLAAGLREHHDKRLILHEADALQFDFSQLFQAEKKLRVVGNLPYNISTPILFHLLEYAPGIQDMHLMLQKEVVDRLAAEPGSKAYGRLSVMIQSCCHVEALMDISPAAFYPEPKVHSAFVRLLPDATLSQRVTDPDRFSSMVRQAFSQRRKTLRNSLKGCVSESAFEEARIDSSLRAEQLSVEEFIRLACL